MGSLIYQWIDLLWLPLGFFAVAPKFRWLTLGFIAACLLMMRMQIELMVYTGYETGILPLMTSHIQTRGLLTYGVFMALFLILANFSNRTQKVVFLAASITIFIAAFLVSTVLMML